MAKPVTRRHALKHLSAAGAAALVPAGIIRGQSAPIVAAGKPVEIIVASVSPNTVRLTVVPIDGARSADDGALVPAAEGKPLGRRRESFAPLKAGNLVVRLRGAGAALVVRLHAVARTLAGPDEVRWVARTFREKKLPCDALIYLGTEFTPSGWNTRNGEFTWKAGNFPVPKAPACCRP